MIRSLPKTRYWVARAVSLLALAFAAGWFLSLVGCESSKKNSPPTAYPGRSAKQAIQSRQNPSLYAGKTTVGTEKPGSPLPAPVFSWPPGFDRVAALPIYSPTPTGGALDDLDTIFRAELSKLLTLEVVSISREELAAVIGEQQIASTAVIPQKLIQYLQTKHAVQGVVFTDMPIYRPYRPMNIAVRSKLVEIPNMDILWSANGILDSAEPGIAASAVQYAERNLRGPGSGGAQVILQSPRRYAAFVANGLYGTLPGQSPMPGLATPPSR